MSLSVGYLQVRAYTSNALIPLKDVSVTVTDLSGAAIAMRLTNRSGLLDAPIAIPTPERTASESPGTGIIPFAVVNLYARYDDYEAIQAEKIQIFADTLTIQDLKMIPLSEFPDSWNKEETFDTPAQNL